MSTKNNAPRYTKKHNTQAVMQTVMMANCLLPAARAIAPARTGASAAPLFSTKYSTDCAELRTSGSVMSYTVEMTFGEAKGMNNAVNIKNPVKSI